MKKKVALIGVGNLGRRHLQSLIDYKRILEIYAVDKNKDCVKFLEQEYGEFIRGATDYSVLPEIIDLLIIATSSDIRRMIFDDIVEKNIVNNIIFEKVLFQNEDDYFHVNDVIKNKSINAFVNCVRREWPGYEKVKTYIGDSKIYKITISGGEWGIGSNGIHLLDLIAFLSGDYPEIIDNKLNGPIVDSKRIGFKEFYGAIIGKTKKNDTQFEICCLKESRVPIFVDLSLENRRITVNEGRGEVSIFDECDGWKNNTEIFEMPYQSQLTGQIAKTLLENPEKCKLTKYDESMQLHLEFLHAVKELFHNQGMKVESCPIT